MPLQAAGGSCLARFTFNRPRSRRWSRRGRTPTRVSSASTSRGSATRRPRCESPSTSRRSRIRGPGSTPTSADRWRAGRGRRRRARDRGVRADEPAGLKAIPAALAGLDIDLRLQFLPFAHYWRQAWSRLGRPAAERFLGAFDVLHFSDWMFPPQRAGIRATTIHDLVPLRYPEWVTKRTLSMHAAQVPARRRDV